MPFGVAFGINGGHVTPPEEVLWTSISIGTAGSGREKRSPYWFCEWRKQVTDACHFDWHDHDNTTLSSLTTTTPTRDDEYAIYTDAICQRVGHRKMRDATLEAFARFMVYVG